MIRFDTVFRALAIVAALTGVARAEGDTLKIVALGDSGDDRAHHRYVGGQRGDSKLSMDEFFEGVGKLRHVGEPAASRITRARAGSLGDH